MVCFFKQKTAYEMRISDWSSDVCSSDLGRGVDRRLESKRVSNAVRRKLDDAASRYLARTLPQAYINHCACDDDVVRTDLVLNRLSRLRSEEHTSELQSLMRISYAVFCLKKKRDYQSNDNIDTNNPARSCEDLI